MDRLPTEIVEKILTTCELSVVDVINTGATCKHFQDIIYNSDRIWKSLYLQNWNLDPTYVQSLQLNETDWLQEVKHVYSVKKTVRCMLEKMADNLYSVPYVGPSELTEWQDYVSNQPGTYHIVMWYLKFLSTDRKEIRSLSVVSLFMPGNKTLQYYCNRVIEYLRRYQLALEHVEFIKLPEKERILEKVATFVSQWCQPIKVIHYDDIQLQLDQLTTEARHELFNINPKHPLFTVPPETLASWRISNLDKHQFDANRCQEILDAINHVLYQKHRLRENCEQFYDLKNSYIDLVLKRCKGLPIVLCIIYESVARRMGLNCEPINMPSHFLLRYLKVDPPSGQSMTQYLNAADHGNMFTRRVCPYSMVTGSDRNRQRADAITVMLRIAANLENAVHELSNSTGDLSALRPIYELTVIAAPTSLNAVLNLARLCMSLNMNASYVENIILSTAYDEEQNANNVLQMLRGYQVHRETENIYEQSRVKRRPPTLKYAVGQVMRHKIFNYVGVITAWTERCNASADWQDSMQIDQLHYKSDQPFYYVIAEDGTNRYVAEENVWLAYFAKNSLQQIEELGRHFSHFDLWFFVPNSAKEREYPDDKWVRETSRYHPDGP